MRLVDQTRFGKPNGNCLQACVATLLGVPLDEVRPTHTGPRWHEDLAEWLAPRGLSFLLLDRIPHWYGGLVIGMGLGPRGLRHSVVWREFTDDPGANPVGLVHDPHPDRSGLVGEPDRFLIFVVLA